MKKIIVLVFCIFILLSGCAAKEETAVFKMGERKVLVEKLENVSKSGIIRYVGTVATDLSVGYSFKTGGKIEAVYIKEGQKIKKGEKIALLENTELSIQKKSTDKQISALAESVKIAEEGLGFAKTQYENAKSLYKENAISKLEYDQMELNYNNALNSYTQANIQRDIAKLSLSSIQEMMGNSTIYAEQDGYITKILYKQGEIVGAGYPVVVIRSESQIVEMGVTQMDISKLSLGDNAYIEINAEKTEGKVVFLDEIPDEKTRTYKVKLVLDKASKQYPLGAITFVDFKEEATSGIWIPLLSILNDGEDYVFINKEGVAYRKNITIEALNEAYVKVSGLDEGDNLVVEGMQDLREGYKLSIER